MTEGHAGAQAPGRLGPDSLIWKYYGDVRVQLFGFQRLASNENSIPELAQGVTDHSVIFGDFLGRAMRTAVPVMKSVYDADADTWGKRVRDFHKDIKGTMPDGSRIRELIISVDDDDRRLVYAVVEGQKLPLTYHQASFQVFDEGPQRSRLVWLTDVLPHTMAPAVRARTERGIVEIKSVIEAQPEPR